MDISTDQRLSKQDVVAIVIGVFLFVAEGINYSLIAPFFPTEAEENKKISHLVVSLISCCFDVSNFVFTPLLAAIATPEMSKFFFITGASFAAVANICFGLLEFGPSGFWFGFMSLICRLFMGVGAGLVWSTGIPLITSLALNYAGRLTALIESGVGVGLVLGAPLGSVMFGLGGYNTPFAFSGAFEIFFIIIAIFLLPSIKPSDTQRHSRSQTSNSCQYGDLATLVEEPAMLIIDNSKPDSQDPTDLELLIRPTEVEKSEKKSKRIFKTFLSYKGVWFVSQFYVFTYLNCGILNVTLSPFLLHNFGVSEKTCGFYWIAYALVYTTWAQAAGYLSDKGYLTKHLLKVPNS